VAGPGRTSPRRWASRAELSGDRIGQFSLVARCTATSVAGGGRLVVGTDEDVLVGDGREFEPTGFGAAAAVSLADGTPVAAAPDGSVARLRGDDCEPVGSVTGPRRALGVRAVAGLAVP
jgi:hypothetical protein